MPAALPRGGVRAPIEPLAVTYVSAPLSQSIDDFITCQHSRQTFARSRMGAAAAAQFDAELANLLSGYANDGVLSYSVETQLAWGAIIDLD